VGKRSLSFLFLDGYMGTRLNYSGFIVAGVGFFLTRFTVTLAIYDDPARFYMAGIVPLVLGLGLAAFGVALAVADFRASFVRTTALWCVLGVGMMSVLVILTLLGSTPDGMPDLATVRSQTYLSNFLIGGGVGGTLTGLYASHNRRQRSELRHQANRLEVLNRLLRHEVLNALTAIRGYAGFGGSEDSKAVIESKADSIEQTIEEVKYLTENARRNEGSITSIDIESHFHDSVQTVRDRYPDANISISTETPSGELSVLANDRLVHVFTNLLENAVTYSMDDEPAVDAHLTATATTVRVSVSDLGPGLPESQQDLLETGEIERFDNPESGYGLNIVRLLVESYNGSIETDVDQNGTTITVVLPRVDIEGPRIRSDPTSPMSVRPAAPQLLVTLLAALVAGVFYGLASRSLGGSIAGIGVFYGATDPVVGWLTHQFHSVVFGFVFASFVSFAPERYRNQILVYVAIGIGWALCLWAFAAGVIAPIWLRLLGISASIPNLSGTLLVSHLVWGGVLGALTALGGTQVTPWIARLNRQSA
jgi:two-component system OmpR family sensor kinase